MLKEGCLGYSIFKRCRFWLEPIATTQSEMRLSRNFTSCEIGIVSLNLAHENSHHGGHALSGTLVSVVVSSSRRYDLICIAGDLLDMFCGESRIAQA